MADPTGICFSPYFSEQKKKNASIVSPADSLTEDAEMGGQDTGYRLAVDDKESREGELTALSRTFSDEMSDSSSPLDNRNFRLTVINMLLFFSCVPWFRYITNGWKQTPGSVSDPALSELFTVFVLIGNVQNVGGGTKIISVGLGIIAFTSISYVVYLMWTPDPRSRAFRRTYVDTLGGTIIIIGGLIFIVGMVGTLKNDLSSKYQQLAVASTLLLGNGFFSMIGFDMITNKLADANWRSFLFECILAVVAWVELSAYASYDHAVCFCFTFFSDMCQVSLSFAIYVG